MILDGQRLVLVILDTSIIVSEVVIVAASKV